MSICSGSAGYLGGMLFVCQKCNKAVESIDMLQDEGEPLMRITVGCHGESEEFECPIPLWEMLKTQKRASVIQPVFVSMALPPIEYELSDEGAAQEDTDPWSVLLGKSNIDE